MVEKILISLLKEITESDDITSDTPVAGNIINSINYIQFIVAIEDKFDIEIPDEYLDITKFNTVKDISSFIHKLLNMGK